MPTVSFLVALHVVVTNTCNASDDKFGNSQFSVKLPCALIYHIDGTSQLQTLYKKCLLEVGIKGMYM